MYEGMEERLTDSKAETANGLDPDRGIGFGGRHAGVPGHVLCGEWADSIGDIVCAVGDGHDLALLDTSESRKLGTTYHSRANLGRCPKMFNLVVKLGSPPMDIFQTLGLVVDDIPGNAVCENKLEGCINALGMSPGQRVQSLELPLVLFRELRVGMLGFVLGVGVALNRLDVRADESGLLALGDGAKGISVLFVGLKIALVVVGDNALVGVAGEVEGVVIAPEERAHGDMPETEATVFLDQADMN
jgi:hypothetical protein